MIELFLMALSLAGQEVEMLGPAREGKLQCVIPDRERKTCRSLTTYTPRADGGFDAVMTQVIASKPVIVMETKAHGVIEGNAVCTTFHLSDSRFLTDGKPVDAATDRAVRKHLSSSTARFEGKRVCSHHTAAGDMFDAQGVSDGQKVGTPQKFNWVAPEDGYRLAS